MTTLDTGHTQLFVDDAIIAHQTLLERVVHAPVRSRLNPLLTPDEPWEQPSLDFIAGVYRDSSSGQFRAWYVTYPQAYPGYHSMLCLATSNDGLHWERPQLDLCQEVIGGPSNVLCVSEQRWDGPTVLPDPDDGERPWKLVFYRDGNVFLGHSRDGVRWTIPRDPADAILPGFGDRTTALLAPGTEDPYVILSRDRKDMQRQLVRCIYRAGSRDAQTIHAAPLLALRPDLEDGPYIEFYQMSAFRYASLYLGFIERYHTDDPPYSDIELTSSRDTRTWRRIRPRTAFFAPPANGREQGAFDGAAATPANSPPILHEGALWIYYYGGASFHGDRFLTRSRCLGLAKLRPDGFVSLRAGRREALLTTVPFTWPGGRLQVNYRVLGGNQWTYDRDGSDGYVRAEILATDGSVMPGYSRDESNPLYRDATAADLTWGEDSARLDTLTGQTIAVRFLLRSAELYAFRFA